jgi:GNAT superfamily N-acetyltransferase
VRQEPSGPYLSNIDSDRFGIPIARVAWMTPEILPVALKFCRESGVRLLMTKCPADATDTIQALERERFLFTEAINVYERNVVKQPIPADKGEVLVRSASTAEAEAIAAMGGEAFRGYPSHYRSDPRLDPAKSDEIYVDWVRRSCLSREVADVVLVAEIEGSPVGVFTIKMNHPKEADTGLAGVVPRARRQGVLEALIIAALQWSKAQGADYLLGLMQMNNVQVLRVTIRLGFFPRSSFFTFHKWFDPE